jgi:hypothetical protein
VLAKLERVTHADDLNRQMALLQLMTQGLVSKSKGLRSVGADFEEETVKSLEEERFTAEQQAKMQEQMQQSQTMQEITPPLVQQMAAGAAPPGAGGAPPAGSAPPAGGGGGDPAAAGAPPMGPQTAVDQFIMSRQTQPNVPRTVEELNGQAQLIAQDLMMRGPQRQSLLIKLKKIDSTMHSLVTAMLEDMDRQMETQGKAMMQQQLQQQGPMGKTASTTSDNSLPPLVLPSNPDTDFGRSCRYIDIG